MKNISSPVGLIRSAFQIFFEKENLVYLVKIYLPLLPFSIFSLIQQEVWSKRVAAMDGSSLETILGGNLWLIVLIAIVNILYLFVYFTISVSGILAVDGVVSGHKKEIKPLYKAAWKKVAKYLLLSMLAGMAVVFGGILLIIPGIIFMVWFSFAQFELVLNDLGVIKSLGRSRNLVRGRFWKVLGRMFVFGLFAIIVQLILMIIPYVGVAIYPLMSALFLLPTYLLYKEISQG